jgi:hypothetical protein
MRYTVTWTPPAQDELATVWLNAPDRRAVTAASHRIDKALRNDPDTQGEEYFGDRILEDEPLAVTFAVYPDDRLVEVPQVRHL